MVRCSTNFLFIPIVFHRHSLEAINLDINIIVISLRYLYDVLDEKHLDINLKTGFDHIFVRTNIWIYCFCTISELWNPRILKEGHNILTRSCKTVFVIHYLIRCYLTISIIPSSCMHELINLHSVSLMNEIN